MRSRYAAFVLEKAHYLASTWHPSTRPAAITFTPGQTWLGLKIVAAGTDDDRGTVSFVARSRIAGASHVLNETSRFVREDGRWLYLDGIVR